MNNFTPKSYGGLFLIILCVLFSVWYGIYTNENTSNIENVVSPIEIKLKSGENFYLKNFKTFDCGYTSNNKQLASALNLTNDEAFILGCLGKYWTKNFLANRTVKIIGDDLIYYKFSYRTRFENSPFGIKNNQIINRAAFDKQLKSIRKSKFVIINLDEDKYYHVSELNAKKFPNFVVVRKSQIRNIFSKEQKNKYKMPHNDYFKSFPVSKYNSTFKDKNIKLILSDHTSVLYPTRNCSSDICKELVSNINQAANKIDIAIYGYSSVPQIEKALSNAKARGVQIRVVYDVDSKGENIYPDTNKFIKMFPNAKNDKFSQEAGKIMHNKFYIFDNSIVITGSANLSHTDMSGFNSNAIVVIKSPEAANIYTKEFEQMFSGNFHNEKSIIKHSQQEEFKIYFSPKESGITDAILPLIKNSKKYIYVPSFIITHKGFIRELINAHNRGVDVKVIVDSLNATGAYSKHKELRNAGIPVKAENYAGKMHSKSVIIDDEYLVIGSMNFSSSGENKNDENMLIMKNPKAAKFYRDFFLYQWTKIPDKWLKFVPRAEGEDSIGSCFDGLDNNYDGKTDKEDLGCIRK